MAGGCECVATQSQPSSGWMCARPSAREDIHTESTLITEISTRAASEKKQGPGLPRRDKNARSDGKLFKSVDSAIGDDCDVLVCCYDRGHHCYCRHPDHHGHGDLHKARPTYTLPPPQSESESPETERAQCANPCRLFRVTRWSFGNVTVGYAPHAMSAASTLAARSLRSPAISAVARWLFGNVSAGQAPHERFDPNNLVPSCFGSFTRGGTARWLFGNLAKECVATMVPGSLGERANKYGEQICAAERAVAEIALSQNGYGKARA
mmetsp:Transcript_113331/g.321108  ORF Transcript_113331/g.321108 Transcript_113331/m.321108 type:complete len:266 (+) Transcript_113331:310-1107(+)